MPSPNKQSKCNWLKLKKEKFNEDEDIFIGTFYLSPENYETNKKLNYMEDLEREIFKFASKGKIILQGDFNARCSNLQDAVIFSKYFSDNNDTIEINIQKLFLPLSF